MSYVKLFYFVEAYSYTRLLAEAFVYIEGGKVISADVSLKSVTS